MRLIAFNYLIRQLLLTSKEQAEKAQIGNAHKRPLENFWLMFYSKHCSQGMRDKTANFEHEKNTNTEVGRNQEFVI